LDLKKKYKRIIRQAYFGGRCEIFGNPRVGEKILHFDFSGMYQNCMLEDLPYGDFQLEPVSDNLISGAGFYHIGITYDEYLPILPVKEDKLYFKSGEISGWFWYEEVLLALKLHKTSRLSVNFKLASKSNGPILRDFITNLAKIRDQGGLKKEIGKLLINSFYGRMGVGDTINAIELKKELKNEKIYGILEDLYIVKREINKNSKANVAIAAAITSKARIKLYAAFGDVLRAGGRLLYCDTDSVIAAFDARASVENLRLGTHLFFDTTKDDTVIKDAVFVNPKTYALLLQDGREIIKIKGMQSSEISFAYLKSSFFSNTGTVELPTTFFFKKNLDIGIMTQKKTLDLRSYNKRLWSDGLYETTPHVSKAPYSH